MKQDRDIPKMTMQDRTGVEVEIYNTPTGHVMTDQEVNKFIGGNSSFTDQITPYIRIGLDNGLNKKDAVFFAFWVYKEVWGIVIQDDLLIDAQTRITYHEFRNEEEKSERWKAIRSARVETIRDRILGNE